MFPGDYRLLITPPQGYVFPSGFGPDSFDGLSTGPFEIIDGSYGLDFTVTSSGPLHFDVPLDTTRGLTVTKDSSVLQASVGDFVVYSIDVTNSSEYALPMRVRDDMPSALRYKQGSSMLDGEAFKEASVEMAGATLTFDGGLIEAGETHQFSYVAVVGPGAENGEAVNRATAINPFGGKLSNTAESAISITEDLLRSESTIIGRVSENACDENEEWSRAISRGEGVEGVRIYLETGEYAVTDERGAYHFEGVKEGTHVVQIDPVTLPEGYTPVKCEENSRFAGSSTSQFVDVMGGAIWRSNFYLKRTAEKVVEEVEADILEAQEYLAFDDAWLNTQNSDVAWVYPDTSRSPSGRSLNIGIKLPAESEISLTLNGLSVDRSNRQPRLLSSDQSTVLKRWRGVDIQSGRNVLKAVITHANGQTQTLTEEVWFVDQAQRAQLVDDQSTLVADGRSTPVVAIRLENAEGRAVHSGRVVEVDVSAPYELKQLDRLGEIAPISTGIVEARGVSVNRDGILMVELEPTLRTGKIRVRVPLAGDRIEEVEAYVRPEKRDWILVGLAEGEIGQFDDDAPLGADENDWNRSGRIALFAKGLVKGDWLLTLAVDTAKRRGNEDDALYDSIDPNAYYTLYGDNSVYGNDAQSRYPVYVKLEKETARILFGDFNTDLSDSELGRYSRQLSGLKAEYEGERFSVSGFAAETNQGFIKDEIAADGTSGPYRLSQGNLVRNSEIITIETRDRNRPDRVLNSVTLQRFTDYEIDVATGEIFFRFPVDATDTGFNENIIVVDYETYADADRNVTFGGRVEMRSFDGKLETGLNYIDEDGAIGDRGRSKLASVDAELELSNKTRIIGEYATSQYDGVEADSVSADAYLLELQHASDGFSAGAYVRQEDAGFGLGQTASNTNAIRRVGAQSSVRIAESIDADTGTRNVSRIEGQAYRETDLASDQNRTVSDASITREGKNYAASTGLRSVQEELNDENRESLLGTFSFRKSFPKAGISVVGSREQPISQSDEASIAPERTILGIDKAVNERVTVNVRHEITNGAHASGENTLVGVTIQPWAGAQVVTGLDRLTQDSSSRLAATIGVDQNIRLNEKWNASLGFTNRSRVDGGDAPQDPLADDAVSPIAEGVRSPLTQDDAYSSGYLGLGFRDSGTAASGRYEYRDSSAALRQAFILGAARELTDSLSYAGGARLQFDDVATGGSDRITTRLGLSWRPEDTPVTIYNRLDFNRESTEGVGETWKVVNNAGLNLLPNDRSQLAIFHGVKYASANLLGQQYSGWTNLVGAEYRYDVTPRIDVGLRGSVLASDASSTMEYQFGPSIGISPKEGAWFSVGYNVWGFKDDDFDAASESRNGLFIKLRLKINQNDLDGLLGWVSPKAGE